jgi:RNA polymerase sigma-70 factor (ECF subfamily)
MSPNDSLNQLLEQLRLGDNDAATALFDKYAGQLIALARSRLSVQLRQKVDPEDIAQSVFKSFFRRQNDDGFTFEDWGGLWGLLVVITMRKCGRRAEWFGAGRRDIRKEVAPKGVSGDSQAEWDFPGGEATPDEAAALTETVERVMAGLDERGRQVLTLRLQGYQVAEISKEVGRTERTVHRTLEQIKIRLAHEMGLGVD